MGIDISDLDLMNQPDEGDPLVWLQKHREYILKKYPTTEERREYYRQFHSVEAARKIMEERAAEEECEEPLEPYVEPEDSNRYYKGMDLMNQPDEGDPLVWLRKHRDYISQKYPTVKELGEYYSQFNSIEATEKIIAERAAAKKRGEPLEP